MRGIKQLGNTFAISRPSLESIPPPTKYLLHDRSKGRIAAGPPDRRHGGKGSAVPGLPPLDRNGQLDRDLSARRAQGVLTLMLGIFATGAIAVSRRDMLQSSPMNLRVRCPNCPTDMTVKTVFPSFSAKDFLEITYVCPRCRAETMRYVKPDAG